MLDKRFSWWYSFQQHIRTEFRFVLDPRFNDFIEHLLTTCYSREKTIETDTVFYRARIGCAPQTHEDPVFPPFPPGELGAPPANLARAGRVNPLGIPFLYLANDVDTAIAEVRPWVNQEVSLALFETVRKLVLIDLSNDVWDLNDVVKYFDDCNPPEDAIERRTWGTMNSAFSFPVQAGDDQNDYAPTQYIAEVFRRAGFDGLIFKSSLTEVGRNVVLFDVTAAKVIAAKVVSLTKIEFSSEDLSRFRVFDQEAWDRYRAT
jgi:hypothetical protein